MEETMKTSEELRRDVIAELVWDGSVDAASVGVAAENGSVTLTGHVRSYAEKRAAEKAAKRVRGVVAVANDVTVHPSDSLKRDDMDIAAAIVNAFKWNVSVPAAVKASVDHGWVTLEGEVSWEHQRRAAEKAVWNLMGVRGVSNLIRLKVQPMPRDIEDRIKRTFERSAQIDAEHVHASVSGGKVTLTGNVRSWSERSEAEHAARAAAGVMDVDNRLTISSYVTTLL
jgi:osmotically-inducible protein OsmY